MLLDAWKCAPNVKISVTQFDAHERTFLLLWRFSSLCQVDRMIFPRDVGQPVFLVTSAQWAYEWSGSDGQDGDIPELSSGSLPPRLL